MTMKLTSEKCKGCGSALFEFEVDRGVCAKCAQTSPELIAPSPTDGAVKLCAGCQKPLTGQDAKYQECITCWQKLNKGKKSSYWWQGDVQIQAAACSHKPIKFLNADNLDVWVGKKSDADSQPFDLIVNCSDFSMTVPKRYPRGFEALAALDPRAAVPILEIGWSDFTAPHFTYQYWTTLWQLLCDKALECTHRYQVLLCCVGGHGRSGTASACLLLASRARPSAKSAIKQMRKFCSGMVETAGQEQYIRKLRKGDSGNEKDIPH